MFQHTSDGYGGMWALLTLCYIDRIIIKVAGNQDRHKSSDEFDFRPDQTTHLGVTCPWMKKILHFQTWISLRPVGQSWSNFLCSITWGWESLHNVLRQIGSKLWWERGGSVVECRTPERDVGGSIPTAAVLCPWARHFTPRKYWLITQEAVAPSRLDWKIVDWDVKPQHKQKNSGVHGNRKGPLTYNGENGVSTFSRLLLIGSFLYLQVTRTCIKSWTSLNFGQVGPLTTELAALERLKKFPIDFS